MKLDLTFLKDGRYLDGLQHSYDTDTRDCNCYPDYCRCGRIVDFQIEKVTPFEFASKIFDDTDDLVTRYCITRILTHSDLVRNDCWEAHIGVGYYGEELNGVEFTGDLEALKNNLVQLTYGSLDDKINIILLNEYKELLADLEDFTWTLETVKLDAIQFRNDLEKSTKKDTVKDYIELFETSEEFRKLPIGLCKQLSNGHRIVDGRHRLLAMKKLSEQYDQKRLSYMLVSKNENERKLSEFLTPGTVQVIVAAQRNQR